jgi:hypothetical protein
MKILLGIAIVLILALAVDRFVLQADTVEPVRRSETRPATNTPASTAQADQHDLLPDIGQLDEIWKRPMFNPDRKAEAAFVSPRTTGSSAQVSTTSDQPPDFKVVGVAIRPGGGSVLIRKSRREMVRVLLGEELDGWRIDELDPQMVTVSRDGESWQIPVGNEE